MANSAKGTDPIFETFQRPIYLIFGGLISMAAGLLLALFAFGIVVVFAGNPTEGGYCSSSGIGRYEAQGPGKVVAYIDEGWSGLPPRHRCRVYLAAATDDNPPPSGKELLQRDPLPHLLVEGTYPETQEYIWVAVAFLLPFSIWGLLTLLGFAKRRMQDGG